jgi:transposase InsO family protein
VDRRSVNALFVEADVMVHGEPVVDVPSPFQFEVVDDEGDDNEAEFSVNALSKNPKFKYYPCRVMSPAVKCDVIVGSVPVDCGSVCAVAPDRKPKLHESSLVLGSFRMNGVRVQGLIDSGATCSLIDPSLVESLDLKVTPQSGMIGSFDPDMKTKRIGTVVVDLKHADKTLTSVTMEVHPNIHKFICGCDIMNRLGIGLYGVSTKDPGFDEEIDRTRSEEHGKDALCTGRNIGPDTWLDEDQTSPMELELIKDAVAPSLADNLAIPTGSFCTDPAAIVPLDTGDSPPIYRSQYPVADVYKSDVTAQVEQWFDDGIIVKAPPDSRYNSPLLPVRKRDDQGNFTKCRVCIDPRPLNECIGDFAYAVPKVTELFARLKGFVYASAIDLKSSYNQFPLAENDRVKTTFTWQCKAGRRFMFAGAPFGIKPLTQRFQSVMEKILEPVSDFALVYVDDIIVFSDGSAEDHAAKTAAVLDLLTAHNLRVNGDKCHFGYTRLRFLGHLLSGTERTPDPRKLMHLNKFSRPSTGKQVMAYLGFVNYLREYVPLYSEIAAPLERLRKLKEITKADWNADCERSYQRFRSILSQAPVLSFPKDGVPYVVATDASQYGVGAVLYQEYDDRRHYISFVSSSLTKGQKNYSATRRELLSIVFALKSFHNYVWGTKFKLLTDHKALTFLFTQKHVNFMLRSWLDFLVDYSFDVVHCPGLLNVIPDCLSRLYAADADVEPAQLEASSSSISVVLYGSRPFRVSVSSLELEVPYPDRKLKEVIRDRLDKKAVPETERLKLLEHYHVMGHFGSELLFRRLWEEGYYWTNMKADCAVTVGQCRQCQQFNAKRGRYRPLRPIAATFPFDHVAIDLAGPYPTSSRGNNFVLVFVDVATRFTIVRSLKSKSMNDVARLLWTVFVDFGFPKILQSDRGGEFVNSALAELATMTGVDHRLVAPYNPQANGLAERSVRTVKSALNKMVEGEKVNWDLILPSVQLSMNYKMTSMLDATPHSLMFTRPSNALADHSLVNSELLSHEELRKRSSEALSGLYPELRLVADGKRAKMKRAVDSRRLKHEDFNVGDTVMAKDERRSSKSDPFYVGPFTVVSRSIKNGTYRLTDAEGELVRTVFPAHKLTLVQAPTDDDVHYVVEKILDHRGSTGAREYLVKWKGYSSEHNSWEPHDSFDSGVMIDAYTKSIATSP